MAIHIYREENAFGRCICADNGKVLVKGTLDLGPRIIWLSLSGGENLFFNDPEKGFFEASAEMADFYGEGARWNIYGGSRLWTAPEHMVYTYFPDNAPVSVEEEPDGFTLIPPPQPENGIQLMIRLRLAPDEARIRVEYGIKNIGERPLSLAPWAISAMDAGGFAFFPHNTRNTDPYPNRLLTLWQASRADDSRFWWGEEFVGVRHQAQGRTFKLGYNNESGLLCWIHPGKRAAFVKKYHHRKGGFYPDAGCSTELFTCDRFTEVESLGLLQTVQPGQIVSHLEEWRVLPFAGQLPQTEGELSALWQELIR